MSFRARVTFAIILAFGATSASIADQYNLSLQDKLITGPKGSLSSPQAASVDERTPPKFTCTS